MRYQMAERLAQAGMELAIASDLAACAERLTTISVELGFAEQAAFVGHGEIASVRAGAIGSLPAAAVELAPGDRVGEIVGVVEAWSGVCVGAVSDAGASATWSGTLWTRGAESTDADVLRMLAQQAGVAFMVAREREVQHDRERHQQALVEAGKSLSRHHDVDALLLHIVELATELVGARYGALGVVDASGKTIDRFMTVGIDEETREQIGELPRGRGILGVLIHDPHPLRLRRIQDDPRSSGFPPHHPPMGSFLGVPITSRGKVTGRLYLTEKQGADEFSEEDEELAISLASQAGIALENAELYTALVDANRHKSAFLASMSHELRSPLNTIIGYTQLLLDPTNQFDEDQLEDLRIIQGSGRHLLALITDLLDLSKIEAGKVQLRTERTDAVRLLRDAVDAIQPQLHAGVELQTATDLDEIELVADPSRVRQMLLNVLGNSAKFTTSGAIRASVALDGQTVRFSVNDDGPGIPKQDLSRLFESFFQSEDALQRTPRAYEGAGLGLAITRHLAQLHGGSVDLQSTFGAGTTVVVELPVRGPVGEIGRR